MFSHLLLLVHLSNPDKLYDLHIKLILLSRDHSENLETVPLHYPALLNEISSLSSFVNPRLYRCLKLTSRLIYSGKDVQAGCLTILRCIEFYGNTYKNVQRLSRILCFIQKSFNVYRLLIDFPDGLRFNIWKK